MKILYIFIILITLTRKNIILYDVLFKQVDNL
jgi:hypothetical protein